MVFRTYETGKDHTFGHSRPAPLYMACVGKDLTPSQSFVPHVTHHAFAQPSFFLSLFMLNLPCSQNRAQPQASNMPGLRGFLRGLTSPSSNRDSSSDSRSNGRSRSTSRGLSHDHHSSHRSRSSSMGPSRPRTHSIDGERRTVRPATGHRNNYAAGHTRVTNSDQGRASSVRKVRSRFRRWKALTHWFSESNMQALKATCPQASSITHGHDRAISRAVAGPDTPTSTGTMRGETMAPKARGGILRVSIAVSTILACVTIMVEIDKVTSKYTQCTRRLPERPLDSSSDSTLKS